MTIRNDFRNGEPAPLPAGRDDMSEQELLNRLRLMLSGYQRDIRMASAALDHVDGEAEAFYDGVLSVLPALCDALASLIADIEGGGGRKNLLTMP